MMILWGGIAGVALAVPMAYEQRGSVARILPKAMYFTYTETDVYWHDLLNYLQYLNQNPTELISAQPVTDAAQAADTPQQVTTAVDDGYPEYSRPYNWYLDNLSRDIEYGNLAYSITRGGETITDGDIGSYGYGTAPGLGWIGGELYVLIYEDIPLAENDPRRIPAGDLDSLREYIRDSGFDHRIAEFDPDVDVLLIPNSRIIDSGGILSDGQQSIYVIGLLAWGVIAVILLMLGLFIGVAIDHRSKWAADDAIGRFLGRVWIELRLCILAFAVTIHCVLLADEFYIGILLLGLLGWLWLYFITVDLRENGWRTFTCNIFASVIKVIRRRQSRLPLHRAMARRIWVWGIPALICVFISICAFGLGNSTYNDFFALICYANVFYGAIGALVFILLYFRTRQEDYTDIAALSARIIDIREGRPSQPLVLPASHRFAPAAEALESIYLGIEQAVTERTRAERTKIEMVTNISHDLKTPLTSIVGYADLLASVEGLPPEAADYVAIITQKSARLNGLIKDLFALSKATTNDLPITPEPLDLTRLCNQLLAEQADAIAAAPITLVPDLPNHECPCYNDGTKLYRVFANLLENALRYSLEGSRVFLSLRAATAEDGSASWRITVRNTSREYIDFTAEEILTRFVRGDRNRTTEGNGLGLPIAKSFTELCGGRFDLSLDGDTFSVTVDLPQSTPPQE